MVKKSNGWNLQEMQETLVKDTEQRISDGFHEIASVESVAMPSQPSEQPSEPPKGVQTYITMEDYGRLMAIKIKRDVIAAKQAAKEKKRPSRTTIATLAEEALLLWLDVQEGKKKVEKL